MKINRKIKVFLLVFFFSFAFCRQSFADDFYYLNINVNIDKNGIGSVSETWDTEDYEGTEKYKPINNLEDIKIEDFKASVNGKKFSELSPWDVDLSFDEKAYKYGINYTDDGIELCWGISNYGENHHQISYKVNPLVVELNDYDMVYFQFINEGMDPAPENAKITIKGFEPFDDDVKMWGFGMEGDIHNKDGAIVMESDGEIAYGTVMLRFPKGYFNTSYKLDDDFETYANMAIEGSDWENNEGGVLEEDDDDGPLGIGMLFAFLGIFAGVFSVIKGSRLSNGIGKLDRNEKFPKIKDLDEKYYRDVPYDGHIENLYLFNKKANPKLKEENMLNAFILKWIYEGCIEVRNEEEGTLFKKNTQYLEILKDPENMGKEEKRFFNMIKASLDHSYSGYIDQKSFTRYAEEHTEEMETLIDSFPILSSLAMEDEGYVKSTKEKGLLFSKTNLDPTDKGIELYTNLITFKNYLKDYSLINEREVREVKIWDYFMIYAAMFGISKEVFKNLQKVYPEYENYSIYNYNTILWANSYSTHVSSSYQNFVSSGSGGSTSFGGGGGSFGGGFGGGSR